MSQYQTVQQPVSHLVFVENDEIVTDSLTVSDVFGKEHGKVIRSIEELQCSKEFTQANFGLSDYRDRSGKRNKKYLLKRDGLMFLVMGYTGEKAAEYKEMFITEFNRMELYIKQQASVPTSREQFIATMRLGIQHEEDLKQLKTDVEQIKEDINERMTIDYSQQEAIRGAVTRRVYKLWEDGTVNKMIHDTRKKLFSAIWKDVKASFAVNSYHNIRQKEFDEVIDYIKVWRPRLV
ncbi:Rha family transcriptional regulator [Bacillus anthracis]|nr:Rha family transcriptional regulator [Bacillus anthracis]